MLGPSGPRTTGRQIHGIPARGTPAGPAVPTPRAARRHAIAPNASGHALAIRLPQPCWQSSDQAGPGFASSRPPPRPGPRAESTRAGP